MKTKAYQAAAISAALLILVLPLFIESSFILHMFILIFFYVALTSAWNIPVIGGKLSLGHATFFGIGGYTAAILYVKLGVTPWLGIFAAVFVSLIVAGIMSLPLIRLRGPFFTLTSIAFAEIFLRIAIHWRGLTNGTVGINIPFKPALLNLTFQSSKPFYYLIFILAVIIVYITYRIRSSALGFHLRAAASNEDAARALGVNVSLVQIVSLMWSAGLTSFISVFYVFYIYTVEPHTLFSFTLFSLQPALNGIIGGLGTLWGPVIGAILMTPFGEFLRFYLGSIQQGLNFVVYGVVLIIVVVYMPGGIDSILKKYFRRNSG